MTEGIPTTGAPDPGSGEPGSGEPGSGEPGSGEPATVVTDGPGSWACLDWRFMLPLPDLGAIWVAADCAEEAAAVSALGLRVCREDEAADTVVARGATADLAALITRLKATMPTATMPTATKPTATRPTATRPTAGRLVKLAVVGRPPRAGLFGLIRPWQAWRRRLRAAGLDVVVEAIALPNAQRATTMVDLGQPLALRLALRRQPASRKGRLLGQVAEAAVRLGLRQMVCRQGVIVATVRGDGAA